MIRKTLFSIVALSLFTFYNIAAQCPNGDLEFGNVNNWSFFTGFNNNTINPGTLLLNTFIPGYVLGQFNLTPAGYYDAVVGGTTLPEVADGNYALQVGNTYAYNSAEIASYTFTVPSSGIISFRFACVLQAPSPVHPTPNNSFFRWWVSNTNNLAVSDQPGNIIVHDELSADAPQDPRLTAMDYGGGLVFFSRWRTVCVNLGEQNAGQTFTIYFAASGCTGSGPTSHWGYAYIDDVCSPNLPVASFSYPSTICNLNNDITVDGSHSTNYDDFTWTLQKLNSNNITDVVAGTDVSQTFTSGTAGQFDITQMYLNGGQTITDNTYYVLTLTLTNCMGKIQQSVIIHVQLPQISTSNSYGCCSNANPVSVNISATITVPYTNNPGTISWYDDNNNFIGNGTSTVTNNSNTIIQNTIAVTTSNLAKYKVTYTDANGCYNEAWAYAIGYGPIYINTDLQINCLSTNACGQRNLSPVLHFFPCTNATCSDPTTYANLLNSGVTYLWNTGETTSSINTQQGMENYSVTITWPCGSETRSMFVPTDPYPGSFPQPYYGTPPVPLNMLYATSGMVVNQQDFVIYNTGMANFATPAYNAYHFRLCIYNRWGQMIWNDEEYTCTGFYNGQIKWDGTGASDNGTYYYTLELQNCDNDAFCPTFPVLGQPCGFWMTGDISVLF